MFRDAEPRRVARSTPPDRARPPPRRSWRAPAPPPTPNQPTDRRPRLARLAVPRGVPPNAEGRLLRPSPASACGSWPAASRPATVGRRVPAPRPTRLRPGWLRPAPTGQAPRPAGRRHGGGRRPPLGALTRSPSDRRTVHRPRLDQPNEGRRRPEALQPVGRRQVRAMRLDTRQGSCGPGPEVCRRMRMPCPGMRRRMRALSPGTHPRTWVPGLGASRRLRVLRLVVCRRRWGPWPVRCQRGRGRHVARGGRGWARCRGLGLLVANRSSGPGCGGRRRQSDRC